MTALAPIMQGFFTERLAQRRASEHTVAAYRDTFRLLLAYAQQQHRRPPSVLDLADIDADLVGGFLDHLEARRGNSVTTRNARLAAIHALFTYAALRCPEHALLIQRVLAIPHKRADSTDVCFLTRAEIDALLAVRTSPPRSGDEITCCYSSPSKPGCGYPNSPHWPAATPYSGPEPTYAAPAKVANNAAPR